MFIYGRKSNINHIIFKRDKLMVLSWKIAVSVSVDRVVARRTSMRSPAFRDSYLYARPGQRADN